MKICFVSDAGSYHTKKWCKWFSEQGHEVYVISFTEGEIENAKVKVINTKTNPRGGDLGKLKYFCAVNEVRSTINEIAPDIINVHYATSYGAVMALTGIKNYFLSVWGADVYDFPQKSFFHKILLKYSLKKAKFLFSTSKAMAEETRKYTSKQIEITPFGVDTNLFNPNKKQRNCRTDGRFVVGTVKTLTPKYGIDYLIKAVSLIVQRRPDISVELRIAGKGEYSEEYKKLAQKCGISDITKWLGFISQETAALEWANMDVAVVYSTLDSESFGVSAVEAEACATPVVISNIPGLMEATIPGKSSIVVERCNEEALYKSLVGLYDDYVLQRELGKNGRTFVETQYEIENCFIKIEDIFKKYLEGMYK